MLLAKSQNDVGQCPANFCGPGHDLTNAQSADQLSYLLCRGCGGFGTDIVPSDGVCGCG